jgi:glycosyltransferase involved in cell wall biosynthesis
MQFVIAGPHATPLRGDGVLDLGAVTEEEKAALLANARALVQPSTNESFSRTVYEAWHFRRPVVVHRDSPATADTVEETGGGWTARSVDDWADVFATIDESADAHIDAIGVRGRAAALGLGSWDDVAARTLEAIRERLTKQAEPPVVALERWAGSPAAAPRFDDGAINVLSLAPLGSMEDAALLAEIFAHVKKKIGVARLFVFEEDCASAIRGELERLFAALGLRDAFVALGDDVQARFAALRDAHVACAFGSPLQRSDRIVQAIAFDIPTVAYDDAVAREFIEPCGVVCERGNVEEAASLLFLAASDRDLRLKVLAEMRYAKTSSNESVRSTSVAAGMSRSKTSIDR